MGENEEKDERRAKNETGKHKGEQWAEKGAINLVELIVDFVFNRSKGKLVLRKVEV